MADDVPEEEKMRRLDDIRRPRKIFELNQKKIGQTYKVLIDRKEGQYFVGRTEFDSPEVDNEVLIPAKGIYLATGHFAQIKITEASEFDLYGTVV